MDNNQKSSKPNSQDKKYPVDKNITDQDFQTKKNIKMVWVPVENVDITKVKELAINVFRDKDKAEMWLTTPLKSLNGKTPIMRLKNSGGNEEVTGLLRKIESGEFT